MSAPYLTRQRHEAARRRTLTVREIRPLASDYLSIVFDCGDFGDFVSGSFDDHVKLFIPGARGEGGKPPMRDYTPRRFDRDKGEFVIEFAIHDAGPATDWARGAKPGDTIEIGGPRGSVALTDRLDWYWLIGDETAIPAISRFLEERPESHALALIAVSGPEAEVPLPTTLMHRAEWLHRPLASASDPAVILDAIARQELPDGEGFVWIAAEASVAKAVREAVLAAGHPLDRMKARGYWVSGKADSTARFD